MKEQALIIEQTYEFPLEKVWEALTDKNQLKQWYFDLDAFKPEVGFQFSFAGKGHKGEEYTHLCTITEVDPLKKLQYSWTYRGHPGYSLVTFELFGNGNKTTLRLTHSGLETFPQDHADFSKMSFTAGWEALTGKLLPEFLAQRG